MKATTASKGRVLPPVWSSRRELDPENGRRLPAVMPVICAETAPLMLATRPSTIDCSTAGVMEVVAASRVMDPAAAGDSVAPGVPGGIRYSCGW